MKHPEVQFYKLSPARRIFNSLLSVLSGHETLRLILDNFTNDLLESGNLKDKINHNQTFSQNPHLNTLNVSRKKQATENKKSFDQSSEMERKCFKRIYFYYDNRYITQDTLNQS